MLKAPASTEVMNESSNVKVGGHSDPQSDAPFMLSTPFVLLHVQPPQEYGSCIVREFGRGVSREVGGIAKQHFDAAQFYNDAAWNVCRVY